MNAERVLMKLSKAASARYNVTCPVCKAEPKQPCRTRTTGRVTDTHMKRIDLQYLEHKRAYRKLTGD